jgi:diaminohydroxyphosphoribosylaminopyrimidine deaminase/5-amino-6-(5-phosphoribosylamino)uracil reductase
LKESEIHHPVRIVVGSREVPKDAAVRNGATDTQFVKDIASLETYLRERRFNRVLIEAGPTLTSSLLKAGLVNELYLYQAPSLLGSGRSMVEGLGISTLSDRMDMKLHCSRIIEGASRTLKSHFTFNDELVSEVC